MVVPIILYGSSVLRKHSAEVNEKDNIQEIVDSLFATLKEAEGIGIAAPQINILKRAFVIDNSPLNEQDLTLEKFEGIFINPVPIDWDSEDIIYREGCRVSRIFLKKLFGQRKYWLDIRIFGL